MSEQAFRHLQSAVASLVEQARGRPIDLRFPLPDDEDTETVRMMIHVNNEIRRARKGHVFSAIQKVISSMVVNELQLHDILDGNDPGDRITSDDLAELADYAPEIGARDDQTAEREAQ